MGWACAGCQIDNKLDPKISSRIVPRKSTRTQSPLTEPHGVVGNELRAVR